MPVTLGFIINTLNGNTEFRTLGERSFFNVQNNNGVLTIINSRGTSHVVTNSEVNAISRRYNELLSRNDGSHRQAKQYVDPQWRETDRIFSPYIAKIIHEFSRQ